VLHLDAQAQFGGGFASGLLMRIKPAAAARSRLDEPFVEEAGASQELLGLSTCWLHKR
jgi:hypothetical protein